MLDNNAFVRYVLAITTLWLPHLVTRVIDWNGAFFVCFFLNQAFVSENMNIPVYKNLKMLYHLILY